MNSDKLESDLIAIVTNLDEATFIYDLLLAYGQPKASISRLRKGDYNFAKSSGEILWKKRLFFRIEKIADLHVLIDEVHKEKHVIKQKPRFLIVTDFETFLAVDTHTNDSLDIPFKELPKHYDFFLPWAGMEKTEYISQNPADRKAAERLGRLYDIIRQDNPLITEEDRHALNVFLSRLLFCFFAEDTDIFAQNQFTNGIASHTSSDGSDLQAYLQRLFEVLNIEERSEYPKFLQDFPYVNGGLFADHSPVPILSAKARRLIIESGALNWKAINPDIFGSMMQAVVHDSMRGDLGMHYTSVENIMKVIKPLFLDELYEELEKAGKSQTKLQQLLKRLQNLRIFDPACGSGNFLIIAFKELCKLEIEILKRLHSRPSGDQMSFGFSKQVTQLSFQFVYSNIELTQFYGIEIDDFAHETAKLSLWLAQHQMNVAFKEVFGVTRPTLPLKEGGNIICCNATRIDWEAVCPKEKDYEIYILGNPPYLGSSMQSKRQKQDMAGVFRGIKGYKNLDYVACWFFIASKFIQNVQARFAFVSTNSVIQGEQVAALWPHILEKNLEINFAYQSFKWTNNAKGNAGVTCVVVGVQNGTTSQKKLYKNNIVHVVKNINPYLLATNFSTIVRRRANSISNVPLMVWGNKPTDNGNFILSKAEKEELIFTNPEIKKYIKKYVGSQEFIRGKERWCIWIRENEKEEAETILAIKNRINNVAKFRLQSRAASTRKAASRSHRFIQVQHEPTNALIIPSVSSARRIYIPIGFLKSDTVINNSAYAIYNPPSFIFAIISSRLHMTWIRAIAGRLKTDYRYSSALCYNTYPFPVISENQQEVLEEHVFNILEEREKHPEKTMAQLYDPNRMPYSLRQAHYEMDLAVDKCYRKQPFSSDEERLEYLFKLYEEMIESEKQ